MITTKKINFILWILPITEFDIALLIDFPSTLDSVWIKTVKKVPQDTLSKFNRLFRIAKMWFHLNGRRLYRSEFESNRFGRSVKELLADIGETKKLKNIFKYMKHN